MISPKEYKFYEFWLFCIIVKSMFDERFVFGKGIIRFSQNLIDSYVNRILVDSCFQ